jgi:hypothetical protein
MLLHKNSYLKFITVLIIQTQTFPQVGDGENLYAIWVKIDKTLPWIELQGEYQTRNEASKAAKRILSNARIKAVKAQRKTKPMKVLTVVSR